MGVGERTRRRHFFARPHPHPTFPRKRGKAPTWRAPSVNSLARRYDKIERIDVPASGVPSEVTQSTAETLAHRRVFTFDEANWRVFRAALARPVRRMSRVAKLLAEPSVLDDR